MLLAHGASVAKINNLGNTILEEAIEADGEGIVECLLDFHALIGPADHLEGTEACSSDVQKTSLAARLSKTIFQGDEDLASDLISRNKLALSQSDADIALQSCSLFNAPSLAKDLLEKGASLEASTYNRRTPLHFAAKFNFLELTQILTKNDSNNWMVDISGYTPLDLSLARGLPNFETTKYLVELGALATQGSNQETTPVIRTDFNLEGFWEGTYTYSSWNTGAVDPTAMTIRVDPSSLKSRYPVWTCIDNDEAGKFEVLGHLLADNTIRFLKLYESIGWLYLGVFDADAMTIRGTWGSNMTVRHGSFEMKKAESWILAC